VKRVVKQSAKRRLFFDPEREKGGNSMRKLLLLIVCLGLVVTAGTSPDFNTLAGPEKNNLIIGTNQEPDQFNPWEGAADTKENVMALFYIGLTYFDSAGNLLAVVHLSFYNPGLLHSA